MGDAVGRVDGMPYKLRRKWVAHGRIRIVKGDVTQVLSHVCTSTYCTAQRFSGLVRVGALGAKLHDISAYYGQNHHI